MASKKAVGEALISSGPGVYIYNPDDEPDSDAMYGGCRFTLAPNAATKLEEPADWNEAANGKWDARVAADHILGQLGSWGVCVVSGPVAGGVAKLKADQPIVDQAERTYLWRTAQWAEELMRSYETRSAPFSLPLPKASEESKAFAWWKKNRKRAEEVVKEMTS